LLNQYKKEQLTQNEAAQIIRELQVLPASDLYESNKAFMSKLSNGFKFKREDQALENISI
jgi:type I restriction enzyme R subunit